MKREKEAQHREEERVSALREKYRGDVELWVMQGKRDRLEVDELWTRVRVPEGVTEEDWRKIMPVY